MQKKNELLKLTGFIILGISFILFILIPVVPFLDLSGSRKAVISGVLLVGGEVLFYLSLFILGKGFYEKIKQKLLSWKTGKKIPDITPDQPESHHLN
jgi:hypothetical protein